MNDGWYSKPGFPFWRGFRDGRGFMWWRESPGELPDLGCADAVSALSGQPCFKRSYELTTVPDSHDWLTRGVWRCPLYAEKDEWLDELIVRL